AVTAELAATGDEKDRHECSHPHPLRPHGARGDHDALQIAHTGAPPRRRAAGDPALAHGTRRALKRKQGPSVLEPCQKFPHFQACARLGPGLERRAPCASLHLEPGTSVWSRERVCPSLGTRCSASTPTRTRSRS